MNPFHLPFSGATWGEIALALGAGVVVVIYVYQVFRPQLQRLLGTRPDPEARAAELLDRYRRQQASEAQPTALPGRHEQRQASPAPPPEVEQTTPSIPRS